MAQHVADRRNGEPDASVENAAGTTEAHEAHDVRDHGDEGDSREPGEPGDAGGSAESAEASDAGGEGAWDDGLIARRARGASAPGGRQGRSRAAALWGADFGPQVPYDTADAPDGPCPAPDGSGQQPSLRGKLPDQPALTGWPSTGTPHPREPYEDETFGEENALGRRVVALRRLVDLSRSRLPRSVLAEADRVLEAADARERLSRRYTTVAIAGATGSGKSSLFNALAGTRLSQAGMRRPTTATPVACSWEVPGAGPADALLDRLGIPASTRRLMRPESNWRGRIDEGARSELEGLVLIDLPDHDSAAEGHREQVERLLRLVDAVVWVVDPEKYADAVLHERYLRPLAGYAEVTFIVLNQTDRLPGDATVAVLNDLRRLLDEDGMALGEHGEPGARVMATSALVGEGIDELRTELAGFVAERRAASLRLSADLDVVVERLRPEYVTPGRATAASAPTGLTEDVREAFSGRLAEAAGAVAAGHAAERAWLRHAERACGTPWAQLQHWYEERRSRKQAAGRTAAVDDEYAGADLELDAEQGDGAGARDAAADLPVDALPAGAPPGGGAAEVFDADGDEGRPAGSQSVLAPEPVSVSASAPAAAVAGTSGGREDSGPRVARPVVAHAVRTVVDQAAAGLPESWRRSVRDAAWRGAAGLPEALDEALRHGTEPEGCRSEAASSEGMGRAAEGTNFEGAGARSERTPVNGPVNGPALKRPFWWNLALVGQLLLLVVQSAGAGCVLSATLGVRLVPEWAGVALLIGGVLGASLLAWGCRFAARGPAAEYGRREERRLRRLVAGCGQVHVLEPVAGELLRYREVREQYVTAAGGTSSP
ncbi:GTPase [Streptomyces marispadix]|uniref:50S ribosome-binding GTPase n=1 Tax=Streptomyces marispadix TaxID=2922868 RepID=A0ABS9SVP9_9ACTN|nr:GTPase [Streptomyces marispadix]MCH6160331.1 50S ribosome-binding GTPase [Streptomyces marispadix]